MRDISRYATEGNAQRPDIMSTRPLPPARVPPGLTASKIRLCDEMRLLFGILACLPGLPLLAAKDKPAASYAIPLPPKPDFAALDWLAGEWAGRIGGKTPQGDVHLYVSYDLDQRFMILREQLSMAATKTVPASSETWMGVLSAAPAGSGYVLRVFSSTGFVSRYQVTASGEQIYFNPEGGERPLPGWLFRRTIQRLNAVQFSETVQAAPANKPFFEYYTAKLSRVIPSKQPSPAPK